MEALLDITAAELRSLGIVDWGYTEEANSSSYEKYSEWLSQGRQGELSYLEGERARKRQSIANYYPEFKSALVFLFDYSQARQRLDEVESPSGVKMASYALGFEGRDYHHVVKERLQEIADRLGRKYRVVVDTAPVLERDLAYRAGLGWFGKNSMLISRDHGSFFMLGSILLSERLPLTLGHSTLETDHCGQCTACADACPTDAIDVETRTLNADDCISTFTIESFKEDATPPKGYHRRTSEIFGCDICQDVCPWNIKLLEGRPLPPSAMSEDSLSHKIVSFFLTRPVKEAVSGLEELSGKQFRRIFKGTVFERGGRVGVLKNLRLFK